MAARNTRRGKWGLRIGIVITNDSGDLGLKITIGGDINQTGLNIDAGWKEPNACMPH